MRTGWFCHCRAGSVSPVVPAQSVYSLAEAWKGWVSISTSRRDPNGFGASSQGCWLHGWQPNIWWCFGLAPVGSCRWRLVLSLSFPLCFLYWCPKIFTFLVPWGSYWAGQVENILEKAQLVNWGVKGEIRHLFWLNALSSVMGFFTESRNTIIIPPWSQ